MELSDLCVWEGRLMSVDDRTGAVYELPMPAQGGGRANVSFVTALHSGKGEHPKPMKAC